MQCFWKNKPFIVSKDTLHKKFNHLLDKETLLNNIRSDIEYYKTSIDFNLHESVDNIITFINGNYKTNNSVITLNYSKNLFSYFCNIDYVCISFYKKGTRKMIGFIMGKPIKVDIEGIEIDTIEVNFLCLVPQLRSLHMSSYMISILSNICIHNYNIISSVYTTGKQLDTSSFSKKEYYHRPLNISKMIETGLLNKLFQTNIVKKVYSSFNYKPNIKRVIEYYNNSSVNINLVQEIKECIVKYSKQEYKIFEIKPMSSVIGFFENPAFHSFVFKDIDHSITDFVTLFQLDTINSANNETCRNGYIYCFFFKEEDSKFDIIERICHYCVHNNIFDMITIMNVFGIHEKDYYINKFIKGSGVLHYYFYNSDIINIEPHQNGLVTI